MKKLVLKQVTYTAVFLSIFFSSFIVWSMINSDSSKDTIIFMIIVFTIVNIFVVTFVYHHNIIEIDFNKENICLFWGLKKTYLDLNDVVLFNSIDSTIIILFQNGDEYKVTYKHSNNTKVISKKLSQESDAAICKKFVEKANKRLEEYKKFKKNKHN